MRCALVLCLFLNFLPQTNIQAGLAVRFLFNNIPGNQIAELRSAASFPSAPSEAQVLTNGLEVGQSNVENYGSLTRGYLEAPQTGYYTFWVAGDDMVQLFICTNRTVPNPDWSQLTLAARCESAVPPRAWHERPEQKSPPIFLERQGRYYFELIHKQGSGADHVAVGWQLPDQTLQRPILARHLIPFPVDPDNGYQFRENVRPWIINPGPPVVVVLPGAPGVNPNDPQVPNIQPPAPPAIPPASAVNRYPGVLGNPKTTVVKEGDPVTLEVSFESSIPAAVQWRVVTNQHYPFYTNPNSPQGQALNGTFDLAGERLSYLEIPSATSGSLGVGFVARVTGFNESGSVIGQVHSIQAHVLATIPDLDPPRIIDVSTRGSDRHLFVTFSEGVNSEANDAFYPADRPSQYNVSEGVTVEAGQLMNYRTVKLTTSQISEGVPYEVTVGQIRDRSIGSGFGNVSAQTVHPFLQVGGSISFHLYDYILQPGLAALTNNASFLLERPSEIGFIQSLEFPQWEEGGHRENYGVHLRGYVVPPVSGNYQFAMAAGDPALLFLSPDEEPNGRQLIASEPVGAPRRAFADAGTAQAARLFEGSPGNISKAIELEAGRKYYIEVLMKAGNGADHVAVAWQKPGDAPIANGMPPIGAKNLTPFGPTLGSVGFLLEQEDILAEEFSTVILEAIPDGTPPYQFQWFLNEEPIPGATNATHPLLLQRQLQGAQLQLAISNSFSFALSQVAAIELISKPPRLLAVGGVPGIARLVLSMDEPADGATMTSPSNYVINQGDITASSVQLINLDREVVLTLSAPLPLGQSTLLVKSLKDNNDGEVLDVEATVSVSPLQSSAIGQNVTPEIHPYNSRDMDVTAGGSDIWNNADDFHFLWEIKTGDFDVKVRVESLEAITKWTKAGLMMRESLDPGSRNHAVVITPKGKAHDPFHDGVGAERYEANARESTGGGTQRWSGPAEGSLFGVYYPNAWIRLQREGTTIRGFRSKDGAQWEKIAETTASYPDEVFVGLCTSARHPSLRTVAKYRDYTSGAEIFSTTLNIRRDGNQAIVEWPAEASGAMLQRTFELTPPQWQNFFDTTGAINLTVPISNNQFFRLVP